jgi:hypothetical protein
MTETKAETFRQRIKAIKCGSCNGFFLPQGQIFATQCNQDCPINAKVDAICAEVLRLAEGMPKIEVYGQIGHCAAEHQHESDQAYIKREVSRG